MTILGHRLVSLFAATLAVGALAGPAFGQSCPTASSTTTFSTTGLQTNCGSTPCTTKSGTQYDTTTNQLTLPGTSGTFSGTANASVTANVYFAAPGDFDRDGWTDFAAADDTDRIYIMRNQTLTCGKSSCTGATSTAPVRCDVTSAGCVAANVLASTDTWWQTTTNKRPAAFRAETTSAGVDKPLKTGVASVSQRMSPMASGDFDGDGWTDFVQVSATHQPTGGSNVVSWPTAARLFLNTKNCRAPASATPTAPCGIGSLCTGQATNGACTGAGLTNGTVQTETQLSCSNNPSSGLATCPNYMPTFATYDLQLGTAITAAVTSGSSPSSGDSTHKPGDFGPIGHPVQNMVVLDWDGDGDLDLLYGHSGGTCPGTLCTYTTFFSGIDVWKNDCADGAWWNSTTKSCSGHIPKFTRSTPNATCLAGASCNNADILIPSTAHNSTTLAPNAYLGFDVSSPYGDKRVPGFAYVDIDKDGDYDLVIGSPGCCSTNYQNRLRIFRGTSNSKTVHTLDTANPIVLSTNNATYPGFEGSLTAVFVSDFSGDGWPDIITGGDAYGYSGTLGGNTRYWKNTGNATTPFGTNWPSCSATPATCAGCNATTCNPSPTTKISNSCGTTTCTATFGSPPTFPDFDMGLQLDYDHDPSNTLDMVMTNGNTSNEFYIFPNRASSAITSACGTATSGVLSTPSSELTVSGACITPSATVPNTTAIKYFLSNDNGTTWSLACTQTGNTTFSPALTGGACCVTFSTITNRQIMWKAELDANTADGTGSPSGCTSTGTAGSPLISSVGASYTYTASSQHYKAGVVVSDGVAYVGSFTQPGNRGHMYLVSADFGTQYEDVGTNLDAQSTRYVYTATTLGTAPAQLAFTTANASSGTLQARIGASSTAQATSVITWMLSARFGVTGSGVSFTKLGAIQDSTPAVLQKPFRPNWYAYLSSVEKARYDAFSTTQSSRLPLAIFASMDGFIHAVYALATATSDSRNGLEAWAFLPPYVASSATADYTATVAAGSTVTTVYPDGSPTLVDFKRSDNAIRTAAIVSDGAGGTALTALDVTQTVTATSSTANTTSGPTPLWSAQPGTSAAGYATSKPAVARVSIGGVEKFIVIAGTGVNASDSSKGKVISGYNLETGALLWNFEMSCPLTSDITVFETDDSGEPGSPTIDGYADRAVFADNCGYVYKINPAQDLSGGYMTNTGYGAISLGVSNGATRYALFTTTASGAIGTPSGDNGQRPITNTIGARSDSTSDVVLFFGTGGLETFTTSKVNEFYAVYAKNGTIRNKLTGTCTASRCEKFYGGVVVTSDTLYLVRSTDALVNVTPGSCDLGSSHLQSYDLNSLNNTFDISSIGGNALTASSGPLYGDGGALYFATVSGKVSRVGSPRAATAGADTTNNTLFNSGTSVNVDSDGAYTLVGWRVVL